MLNYLSLELHVNRETAVDPSGSLHITLQSNLIFCTRKKKLAITHLAVRISRQFESSRQEQVGNKLYRVRFLRTRKMREIMTKCIVCCIG
jgi:hypothetical protein